MFISNILKLKIVIWKLYILKVFPFENVFSITKKLKVTLFILQYHFNNASYLLRVFEFYFLKFGSVWILHPKVLEFLV